MRITKSLNLVCFLSIFGPVHSVSSTTDILSSTLVSSPPSPATSSKPATTPTNRPTFPPVGSVPRDYSATGLEKIWDLVGGPVSPPPFTTTRVPCTPIPVPTPPSLYPEWFSPRPANLLPNLKFPEGFVFGVATAAFQVEGAAKADGKGPSIWDWNSRQPGGVPDGSTGDVVHLQYYLYKEDVERVAALGVNAHSFSISWARIFPFGTADSPLNQAGLDHYSDVIDYHLQAGVEPIVTLFHWDTPLALHAYYGGFMAPESVDDFVHYAKTVFKAYNGRVKTWFTFNEPRGFCGFFGSSQFTFGAILPPPLNVSSAPFHCIYNILRAHAGAVKDLLRTKTPAFREMGIEGEISFKSENFIGPPWRANSTEDAEASERRTAFQIGIFADPVFITGDWRKILTDTLSPEYLPRLTEEEKKDILGAPFPLSSFFRPTLQYQPSTKRLRLRRFLRY
ncbi:hypothetical protein NLJ89_g3092 [Agrocybe chaxingu]|uniref:Glycoside hydrolase family 1 protein n=1 Tax=Agrocybe chaxingu TaxID=84603 RepID=A0A9W8MXM1_9AGAR|nr:hypothetical protein NLJ89_g3092 [Agrocybe chaxingu]